MPANSKFMAMSVARTRPSTALRPCAFSRCVRSPSACMNVLAAARVPPTPPAWPRAIPISGRRLADQKADGHWRQLLAECRYRRATAAWQSDGHRALNCARPKHELRRSTTPAPALTRYLQRLGALRSSVSSCRTLRLQSTPLPRPNFFACLPLLPVHNGPQGHKLLLRGRFVGTPTAHSIAPCSVPAKGDDRCEI